MNQYYQLLSNENIECPYCKKISNLYAINQHLKSKRCNKYKSYFLEMYPDKKEIEFLMYINDLKQQILYGDNFETL